MTSPRPNQPTTFESGQDPCPRSAPYDSETEGLSRLAWRTALLLITTLPQSEAEAVLLRRIMGFTAIEAGHILGREPGAIRTAAYHGLRKLAHHAHQLNLNPCLAENLRNGASPSISDEPPGTT